MTSTSSRLVAFVALVAALFLPLVACGSSPQLVPTTYCVGPEKINDLGDLLHREMVRYPDEYCARGALPQGFAIVSAPDWSSVPDIGEDVDFDSNWGYHRSHRYVSHVVVHVVNPPSPPRTSVLLVREPTVGSSQVRSSASAAAARARKAGVSGVPSGSGPNGTGSSTVTRGGLGVSGGADKKDTATQAKLKAQTDAASRAAKAGRDKPSSSKTSTSSSRSPGSKGK